MPEHEVREGRNGVVETTRMNLHDPIPCISYQQYINGRERLYAVDKCFNLWLLYIDCHCWLFQLQWCAFVWPHVSRIYYYGFAPLGEPKEDTIPPATVGALRWGKRIRPVACTVWFSLDKTDCTRNSRNIEESFEIQEFSQNLSGRCRMLSVSVNIIGTPFA